MKKTPIIVWLWNFMVSEICDTCMFLNSARTIWIAIEQTYSKAKDVAQICDVKVKTMAAKQGTKTVTEYANPLKALWMELDHYRSLRPNVTRIQVGNEEYLFTSLRGSVEIF
uniref:Retrotransposon gag domain-containing protein n=1 Tax=Phaseolus vulgaris TaxID=3885 RepID=V7BHJ0_PHAVU|nr:hypothetical protein PHAVU_007G115000g [Phaseolus vulgaris]ESW15931.1 hypothetical protein PHAVU_007G115000g [Phaseolus vulgaris]